MPVSYHDCKSNILDADKAENYVPLMEDAVLKAHLGELSLCFLLGQGNNCFATMPEYFVFTWVFPQKKAF